MYKKKYNPVMFSVQEARNIWFGGMCDMRLLSSDSLRDKKLLKLVLPSLIFLSFCLLIAIGLWVKTDLLWPKHVYPVVRFDYDSMEERIQANMENDVPLYLAVVPVSERSRPVSGNFPCDYDIYGFHTGDDLIQKPFILATINETTSSMRLKNGIGEVYVPTTYSHNEYRMRDVFYSLAHLTSMQEPLYYVLASSKSGSLICVIIGDTAYCLNDLYADWLEEEQPYADAFDTGGKEIITLKVAYQ